MERVLRSASTFIVSESAKSANLSKPMPHVAFFKWKSRKFCKCRGGVLFPASQLASPSHLLKHKHLEKRLVPDCILLIQQHKPAKSPRKIIPQNPFETAKNASETPVL